MLDVNCRLRGYGWPVGRAGAGRVSVSDMAGSCSAIVARSKQNFVQISRPSAFHAKVA